MLIPGKPGAPSRNRTGTTLRSTDFKSVASTCSAIGAPLSRTAKINMRHNRAMQRPQRVQPPRSGASLLFAWIALFGLTGCDLLQPPALPQGTTVAVSSERMLVTGQIVGFDNAAGGHTWLGIPYAQAPINDLRWRAPRAPEPWREVRPALRAGQPCIQYGSALGGVGTAGSREGNEDCLTLNIYAPAMTPEEVASASLPVMVFVHGGGNTIGHAAFYDGSVLAAREQVLVIMINYRLGPFGWFVPPPRPDRPGDNANPFTADPRQLAALDASGNYGILDAIAALHWVQDNARALGGDPARVTVFGESAGGTNVLALLVSPLAQDLFHRAIIQSLGFGFSRLPTPDSPYSTESVSERLGIPAASASERLQTLDPWSLYAAFERPANEWQRLPTAFQDGVVVPLGDTLELLADPATHHDVPVILGTNRDEAKIFMAFDSRHSRQFAGLPYSLKDPDAYELESRYRGRLWAADGVDALATPLAAGAPVFAYRWDWDDQGKAYGFIDLSQLLGAAHALEIPFVTGHFQVGSQTKMLFHDDNAAGRERLSQQMMGYWAEFARTGRPGAAGGIAGAIDWPAWPTDPAPAQRLIFDTPTDGGLSVATEKLSRERVASEIFAEPIDGAARCKLFRATFRNADDPGADALWTQLSVNRCEGARWLAPGTPPPSSHP